MFTSTNPATGEDFAQHPELDAAQLDARLDKAASAYARWRHSQLAERLALLHRLAELFTRHEERLARMASLEMGKTFASARAEVQKCAACFKHFAAHGEHLLGGERYKLSTGGEARIKFLPLGVVLAVMPWNFPYWQVVRFLAPMILAGNAGVLKHASIVQGCAQLLEEMVREAGAPDGLFQNLAVKSGAIEAVIADPRIAAVTLTGSEGAGAAVAQAAGKHLKKVVLELGGSDPFIVMPSADLDKAVTQAVTARIQNTGQSCICGKRMIVHADIFPTFHEKFAAALAAVKHGDPFDDSVQMGPLSSAAQRETVRQQLAQAQKAGARLTGGVAPAGPGAYLTAGLLTQVAPDSKLMGEEIFGPIAMLFRAADIGEAIQLANAAPYGLGSSVWTQDPAEQERFVQEIEAGMTAVNQMLASSPEAPFGGIKRSGHGRELGPYGLHEFMNLKTVLYAA